ncbi:MAG: DUF1232 domain-containing protein [Rhodothermaceae bacterium]|nr:DUF1232 domain-containing protein [Rhodothermaceae bacterium]
MLKSFIVAILGLVSLLYLLNPSMGFLELIPDVLPFIGNLDEGAAMTLLLMSLRYFGLDITKLFDRTKPVQKEIP